MGEAEKIARLSARPAAKWKAMTTIFYKVGQTARCVLPDGCRFVFLSRDSKPDLCPLDKSGEHEISIFDEGGPLPMACCVVDLAHVPEWLALTTAQVGRVMDRIDREIASNPSAFPHQKTPPADG